MYLTDVAIWVVKLNAELQLVPHPDAPCICILQALGQRLGQVQTTSHLVSFGYIVDNFHISVRVHLVFVGRNGS